MVITVQANKNAGHNSQRDVPSVSGLLMSANDSWRQVKNGRMYGRAGKNPKFRSTEASVVQSKSLLMRNYITYQLMKNIL